MINAANIILFEQATARILLGLKKTGFGSGKYTTIGGKAYLNESPVETATREFLEETGVRVRTTDLQPMAAIRFHFNDHPENNLHLQIFITGRWEGTPRETPEIKPSWFPISSLPYDSMWPDAKHWLPYVLNGKRIDALFTYDSTTGQLRSFNINQLAKK